MSTPMSTRVVTGSLNWDVRRRRVTLRRGGEPPIASLWTLTWTSLLTSSVHHAAMHTTDTPNPRSISDLLADDRLVLSVAEAGALLGLSRAFAYELVARGELPVVRFGRRIVVPKAALLELLSIAVDVRVIPQPNVQVIHHWAPAILSTPSHLPAPVDACR